MSRRIVISLVAAGVLVAGAAAGGLIAIQQRQAGQDRAARATADAFARAWTTRMVVGPDVRYAGSTPAAVGASFATTTKGLGTGPVSAKVTSFSRAGDRGAAKLAVSWTLPGGVPWSYQESVAVGRSGDGWAVTVPSDRSLWHPALDAKATLNAQRTWGRRGDVLDRKGSAILAVGKVYDVQIDPTRATAASVAALEKVVAEPAGSLVAKLNATLKAGSGAPIPVIAYREADFQARRARLDALAGVIYPPREQPLPPTRTFGQPMLGSYGPVSAEMVAKGKGRYVAGDYAGLSGIQGQYDARLRGKPGVTVVSSAKPDVPLLAQPAVDGEDLTLTLDPVVQSAAESALAGSGTVPSALVAVDVKTGDLLAVANSPALGFDRALQGQYQPGSTLKVATTYSLLSQGLSPATRVPCPPTTTVDGLSVRNYEGGSFGNVPFSVDFANSCNTAFVALAATMGDSDVHDAALALGIGAGWEKHLGVGSAFGGSVPVATSRTEKAATAFGQAKALASPAAMAVMAGSVARGSYIEPALITAPSVPGADRTPKPLDAKAIPQLRQLMRLAVTDGSGAALKGVPGGPVMGKSGTAEHGSKTPPETRAWFVGWQGDVAFAVLVEQGKSGGTVAAPLAKAFLAGLR